MFGALGGGILGAGFSDIMEERNAGADNDDDDPIPPTPRDLLAAKDGSPTNTMQADTIAAKGAVPTNAMKANTNGAKDAAPAKAEKTMAPRPRRSIPPHHRPLHSCRSTSG